MSAGATYSLVLLDNGEVYSFGYRASGELGNLFDLDFETPDTLWRNKPARIETISQVTAIAAGYSHTYLLRENGEVYYCGGGYWEGETYEPELSASFGKVEAISVGSPARYVDQPVLALLENGDVYVFGFGNRPSGPLGLKNVRAVAAGGYHALILLKNGNVLSYGRGIEGQLGHSNNDDLDEPKKIEGISGAVAIAAGEYHSLVLLLNGDVYSFGSGRLGQLGHGGYISSNIPLKISSLDNTVGIAAGAKHSLVIKRRSNED